jgi:hypothetical protein
VDEVKVIARQREISIVLHAACHYERQKRLIRVTCDCFDERSSLFNPQYSNPPSIVSGQVHQIHRVR